MLTEGQELLYEKSLVPIYWVSSQMHTMSCGLLTFHSEQFHGIQTQTRKSSWMWCYAVGPVCSSILRDCSAFIFKVKEFVVWPWIYGHYDPSKCHGLLAWWHSITPLKTCMCNTTIMSTMTLEATCKQGLLQCLWLNTELVGITVTVIHMQ